MLTIRLLTKADMALGMRLKAEAGWNQTVDDWRRALMLEPEGCFVGQWEDEPVATLTTCRFGDVAWIGMVLTDSRFRGRGIATSLMKRAVDWLCDRGVVTIRLDATDLGRPVYEKLGFTTEYRLQRFHGVVSDVPWGTPRRGLTIRNVTTADLPQIVTLDRRASGADRRRLLSLLIDADPNCAWAVESDGDVTGFALYRPGTQARQLGPIVAATPEAGEALLVHTLRSHTRIPAYLDTVDTSERATAIAGIAGCTFQRPFHRMTFGAKIFDDRSLIWASGGPENG